MVPIEVIHPKIYLKNLLKDSVVNILKPNGDIEGILSQSTVVQYLYENRKKFPELDQAMNKTVSMHLCVISV